MRLALPLITLSAAAAAAATTTTTTLPSSLLMLDSIIARGQGTVSSSGAITSTLESGLLAAALAAAITQYPSCSRRHAAYLGHVLSVASAALDDPAAVPLLLDRFSIATGIEAARALRVPIPDAAAVDAAHRALDASLARQPRNPDGGFWYTAHPDRSYLDGTYPLLPFMAAAAPPDHADMLLQLRLLARRCRHPASGLYVHGYDWSRAAVWADPVTGASPLVWARSLGWLLAGLVQAWERLGCCRRHHGHHQHRLAEVCAEMSEVVADAAPRLVALADPHTGVWWQLPTLGGRPGNFLESSATALFVFALLKARRLGMVEPRGDGDGDGDGIRRAALRAYDYTRANFVTDSGNGTVGFNGTVAVCSLNSTATFEYYTSRPLVPNGLLGSAAFVLASLEVEKLAA